MQFCRCVLLDVGYVTIIDNSNKIKIVVNAIFKFLLLLITWLVFYVFAQNKSKMPAMSLVVVVVVVKTNRL